MCVCVCCEPEGELYTSDLNGSDECGDGTEQKPFKTILQVIVFTVQRVAFVLRLQKLTIKLID